MSLGQLHFALACHVVFTSMKKAAGKPAAFFVLLLARSYCCTMSASNTPRKMINIHSAMLPVGQFVAR